jgi:hypothetical protein
MRARLLTRALVVGTLLLSVPLIAVAGPDATQDYDATLDTPPQHPTVPTGQADVDGTQVAFREIDSGVLNRSNSALPVAADEGLWRRSKSLPIGNRIRLHVSDASLPADGHSLLHLVVRLLDAQGRPITRITRARIETSLGRLQTRTGKQAAGFEMAISKGVAQLDLLAPVTPGQALIRVSSGAVRVEGKVTFLPELRPMIAVGIIESGVSLQHVSADPNAPPAANIGFEDSLQHWGNDQSNGTSSGVEGRAAGFVKGTIDGDVLLTAAYDSNKINAQKFFADVDPNLYFPISGDASLINYDARSTSKLYLRLDQGQSHLLYGDFDTVAPTDPQWLGNYARTLTGFTAHYETPLTRVNVFAAETSTHQFVDEQPGRGISGPYAVSQPNAVANSETVQILVRDRNQPAMVLSSQTLTRYVDYDFEPFTGQIVFRQPVPSVGENLNPVSIRITYEVDGGGPQHLVDGANAEVLIHDTVSVGGRYSEDRDPMTPFKLYGADTVWRLSPETTLTVDGAHSEGNQLYSTALDGALTAVSTTGGLISDDPNGNAGRVELVHHDDDFDARLYAAKADLTFENANASLAPGSSEAGLHATYRLTDQTQVVVDGVHTTDETTDANRTGGTADVETHVWAGAKLETGLSYVDQTYNAALPAVAQYDIGAVPGTATGAPLNNAAFGFTGGGLLASPLAGPLALPLTGASSIIEQDYLAASVKLTQQITQDASVYGQYEHTVTGDSGQMVAVGGEYRVSDSERFYVRYEDIDSLTGIYGLGDGSAAHQAVVGVDTSYMPDGTVYNEYRIAGTESGQSAADALGVRNLWHIAPGLNATTSVERQEVIDPAPLPDSPAGLLTGTESATALALDLDYVGSPLWKTAERIEYRFSDVETEWLSTFAIMRKLSDNWSLIGRNIYLSENDSTGDSIPGQTSVDEQQDRLQLGVAYRDTSTNLWNALARYEYQTDYNNEPVIGTDSHTQILALVTNFHPVRDWEFEGDLAGKVVREILNQSPSNFSAVLLAGRAMWDFNPRWDVGLLGSSTTGGGTSDQGVAVEVGYRVIDNLWLSGGGIAGRYADAELFSSNSSWRGVYVRVRFKFDESTFQMGDPQTNRSLDSAATSARQ